MDKIAKVPHLREELDWLDQTYVVEKEGFFHQEHWQLLVAIMLSAQSTDKQVDEVLPKLYGRFPTVQEIAQATLYRAAAVVPQFPRCCQRRSLLLLRHTGTEPFSHTLTPDGPGVVKGQSHTFPPPAAWRCGPLDSPPAPRRPP